MYVNLAKMAESLKPLKFGVFSIITRYNNIKVLANMREYFTTWCEVKDANSYSYENLINFLEFANMTKDILPLARSGILVYRPSADPSKTSYKDTNNTYIIDINNSITPFSKLSIYLDLDDRLAEIKYISETYKDVFILSGNKGAIHINDKDATYTRIFALQEIRYAILMHIQRYIAELYDLYT